MDFGHIETPRERKSQVRTLVRSLSFRRTKKVSSSRLEPVGHHTAEVWKRPGQSRIGINLQSFKGYVVATDVESGSPASSVVDKDDAILAINGVSVHDDAQLASRLITFATYQDCSSGKLLPVRLTLARLEMAELDSPKGVEDLLDGAGAPVERMDTIQML